MRGMTYDQIIRHYKTFTQAAKAVGVSTATLNNWKRRGVPLEQQVEIEARTEGRLRAKLPSYFRRKEATV